MIAGIGTDLIDVARIARAAHNPRFLMRIYTQAERERILSRGEQTAAGLFAAKEACAKALGTGFRGFFASDIEILNDALGKPFVVLHGGAQARYEAMGAKRIHVAITHAGGFAQAFCVIEG